MHTKQDTQNMFSQLRNRLQCYDWWTKLFWSASQNDLRKYDNIKKITTAQGGDYRTGWLRDYPYFKEHFKLIAN